MSTTGEICVNTLKKDWKSSYGIEHILITVKCLLIYPNAESALDEEAGKLLLDNYESYCERAQLITNVHATPRVRPAEFDTMSPLPSASASTSSSSKPAAPLLPQPPIQSATPAPLLTPSAVIPKVARKSASPPAQPLKSAPSNTLTMPTVTSALPLSVDNDGREGHALPSPLGTANANVGPVQATMTVTAKKAVKRAATGGGTPGAEKRKKALRRL